MGRSGRPKNLRGGRPPEGRPPGHYGEVLCLGGDEGVRSVRVARDVLPSHRHEVLLPTGEGVGGLLSLLQAAVQEVVGFLEKAANIIGLGLE